MDLSQLTKEQKQYIFLGAIGVVAAGYGLFLGINFALGGLTESKTELENLTAKVSRAERELAGRIKTRNEFEEAVAALEKHLNYIPPEMNYYSWATEIVYARGRAAGLEVESVDEVVGKSSKAKDLAANDPVYFETYSLQVTAYGGFEAIKSFLKDVEENHPLVRFSGVEISTSQNPERHNVQLTLQWPFRLNRIAELWQDSERRPKKNRGPQAEEAMPAVVKAESRPEPRPAPVEAPAPKPEPVKAEPVVAAESDPRPVRQPTPPSEPVPAAKPKPSRVVVKLPAPAPVEESEPMTVQEPKAAAVPPVIVKAPEPVKPEPVAEKAPEPKAAAVPPVIVKAPEPVKPEPVAEKAPEPKAAAVPPVIVKAPEPVKPEPVAEKAPEPKAEAVPPVIVKAPEPVKPEPVAVKAPEPEPVPEPVIADAEPPPEKVDEHFADILASIDQMTADAEEKKAEEKNPEQEEMASLLASLNSRGIEPEPVSEPAPAAAADDLEAYVKQLASKPVEEPVPEPVQEPVQERAAEAAAEPEVSSAADEPVRYVNSSKSAKILEEMLTKKRPQTSKSLGSFLDGIVGDINEKR